MLAAFSFALGLSVLAGRSLVLALEPECLEQVMFNGVQRTFTLTYNFTGAAQYFQVPPGVDAVHVTANAAQGGGVRGGKGARTVGTIQAAEREILHIFVGGKGGSTGAAGYNGGGAGFGSYGTGGGGGTDVRRGGDSIVDRVLIAGGGGGEDTYAGVPGGGGGLVGSAHVPLTSQSIGNFGRTGTHTAGGSGHASGSLGWGATGCNRSTAEFPGAGGGGGYFGGGSGCGGSGGGGSSFVYGGSTEAGYNEGHGSVQLQYTHSTRFIFGYTGGMQRFVVPDGVVNVSIRAAGAAGGSAFNGYGMEVFASLPVTAGDTYYINAGGMPNGKAGGYNGGGDGTFGSGGGGATDIRFPSSDLVDRIVTAGGGGGGDSMHKNLGGDGGYAEGGHGELHIAIGSHSRTGSGGTHFQAGCGISCGGLGYGGAGCASASEAGSGTGGGGGFFGGGGGCMGGGGGGSSYSDYAWTYMPMKESGAGYIVVDVHSSEKDDITMDQIRELLVCAPGECCAPNTIPTASPPVPQPIVDPTLAPISTPTAAPICTPTAA
ncbi:glycine rich protein-domain-containing protein, partial [Ochromonadaceae sp. CCMP2298]